MPVRTTIPYSAGTFFITFTCKDWLPLIEQCNGYDAIYNWFHILKSKGHFVNGYVIMPNHIHALITFIESPIQINTVIGNGKRFLAYEFVRLLRQSKQFALLHTLHKSVEPSRRVNKKIHDIWQNSFYWKRCESDWFKYQKLDYIHANPCHGKWNLSLNHESYLHSSAAFYTTGIQGFFPVDNIESIKDVVIFPQRPSFGGDVEGK